MLSKAKHNPNYTYIDLFSGCGGLSLGLGCAGWRGIFAIEKDPMAFLTFRNNMIDDKGQYAHFDWPDWLPVEAMSIESILHNFSTQLESLKGNIDLIAGAPPCQGFSLAGMRNPKDPRNKMSQEYIKMVSIIMPKYVLLENVRGFNTVFKNSTGISSKTPYSEIIQNSIEKLGYNVFKDYVNSEDFGVPQKRTRFIMIGVRKDISIQETNPIMELKELRTSFLKKKGLPLKAISVKESISDLEINRENARLIVHSGSGKNKFNKLDYKPPTRLTKYQKLMRSNMSDTAPNSLRLARHNDNTIQKFELIHSLCRPGHTLNNTERKLIGTKKQATCVLNENEPSKTLTTLPDDLIHYSEPRILTVRESARIQSFPDNFRFFGKYTTGGSRRKEECPRYTQVGNAVPPLLGEAIGQLIKEL